MSLHRMPKAECLKCFSTLDAHHNAEKTEDEKPAPGDFSICLKCGNLMVFEKNMDLRNASEDEEKAVLEENKFMSVVRRMVELRRLGRIL